MGGIQELYILINVSSLSRWAYLVRAIYIPRQMHLCMFARSLPSLDVPLAAFLLKRKKKKKKGALIKKFSFSHHLHFDHSSPDLFLVKIFCSSLSFQVIVVIFSLSASSCFERRWWDYVWIVSVSDFSFFFCLFLTICLMTQIDLSVEFCSFTVLWLFHA